MNRRNYNRCQKCQRVAFSPAFSWMVGEFMWFIAGFTPTDIVCLDCYAATLRRKFRLRTRDLDTLMLQAAAKYHKQRKAKTSQAVES